MEIHFRGVDFSYDGHHPALDGAYARIKHGSGVAVDSLGGQLGVVLEDKFLFNTNGKENICPGRPKASDDEVFEAAGQAGIAEFIRALTLGYDTLAGERGAGLIHCNQRPHQGNTIP